MPPGDQQSSVFIAGQTGQSACHSPAVTTKENTCTYSNLVSLGSSKTAGAFENRISSPRSHVCSHRGTCVDHEASGGGIGTPLKWC